MWSLFTGFSADGAYGLTDHDASILMERVRAEPVVHRRHVEVWHLLAHASVVPALPWGRTDQTLEMGI